MTEHQASQLSDLPAAPPPEPQYRRVHIIVNPVSGQDRPILTILNNAFKTSNIDWDVKVTKEAGDARCLAEEALQQGVDAVGVYGGDGTVMEVASALAGTQMPLAIFPGGTANVISLELGIPSDPAEACALVAGGRSAVHAIDVGKFGDKIFLTRLGMGLDSSAIEHTNREQKDRMGWLAYALNTLRELADPKMSHYTLTLDGQVVEIDGLMCIAANSGIFSVHLGVLGGPVLTFAPNISVTDGLLDVLVIRRGDLGSLLEVAASIVTGSDNAEPMPHWQVREVTIRADPPQPIQLDGEIVWQDVVHASVWPQALRVIVPASARPPTATAQGFQPAGDSTAGSPGQTRNGPGSDTAIENTVNPDADTLPHIRPPL